MYFFEKRAILARSRCEKGFFSLSIERQHGATPWTAGDRVRAAVDRLRGVRRCARRGEGAARDREETSGIPAARAVDQAREEAKRLRSDPAAIEDLARRELGLIKPGEHLFILKDRPSTPER